MSEIDIVREWLDSLESGHWPRGRVIASKQAKVLRKFMEKHEQYEAWCAEQAAMMRMG